MSKEAGERDDEIVRGSASGCYCDEGESGNLAKRELSIVSLLRQPKWAWIDAKSPANIEQSEANKGKDSKHAIPL